MEKGKRESGLSEVIGFLMIVTLLSILFSMYLLYVVPLQGRDAEIAHMSAIKDLFQNIKSDVDTLIVNDRTDIPVERMVPLGTGPASSSGTLGFIPIQSFSGSGGTLTVNENDGSTTNISIFKAKSYGEETAISGATDNLTGIVLDPTPISITIRPYLFNISYQAGSLSDPYRVNISDTQGRWVGMITAVPHYSLNTSDMENINSTGYMDHPAYPRITYDLTLSTIKSGETTIAELPIARDISAAKTYTINLYEWAYGLIGDIPNEYQVNIKAEKTGLTNTTSFPIKQKTYGITQYPRDTTERYLNSNHPTGQITYTSSNRYWVDQTYRYQGGSVFVSQSDGSSVLYNPPIAIRKDGSSIFVNITDIQVTGDEMISGSQQNPVYAALSSIDGYTKAKDGQTYHLMDDIPNAQYAWIQIKTDEESKGRWLEVFSRVAALAMKDKQLKNDISVFALDDSANLIVGSGVVPQVSGLTTENEIIDKLATTIEPHLLVNYRHATVQANLQTTSL